MIGPRKTHHFTKLAKYNQGTVLQQVFQMGEDEKNHK